MRRTRFNRLGSLVSLLALGACIGNDAPTAPALPLDVQRPAFTLVDPGAEVNTEILVAPITCSATGTVTVKLSGVTPPPEDVPLDLMLVLDESGSISSADFARIRTASLSLLDRLERADGAADNKLTGIRVGVVQFSGDARLWFPLNGTYTTVRNQLQSMYQRGGSTNIGAGLTLARTQLVSNGLVNASKAVVFMTDGVANVGAVTESAQLTIASQVKDLPARLFTVGVGAVDAALVNAMASPNSYAGLSDFNNLGTAFDAIATQALQRPAASNLVFSAAVPAGFTLVPGSGTASEGSVTLSENTVSWSVPQLDAETVTLTYTIRHDRAAAPGGSPAGVTDAKLTLKRPVTGTQFNETFADVPVQLVGCDSTAPDIAASVAGTLGQNGWYTTDAALTWTVTDAESPITAKAGCDAVTVTQDGAGESFTCTATSAGGTASQTVTIKRDGTLPSVQGSLSGPLGNAGWYTGDVGVRWTTGDAGSGIETLSGCAEQALTSDTGLARYTCTATDKAGNSASATVTAKRDATAPLVAFSGNLGSYTADQTVAITCVASDALSGVASSDCPGARGAAYTFGVGSHTLDAKATDVAGNQGAASATFTVTVTPASLVTLIESWVTQKGVANSLAQQIRNGSVQAFKSHLQAQTGKSISAENAAILARLADAL